MRRPPLGEILQQRRRWAAGNIEAARKLPLGYQLLVRVRNYAWALSPIVTLVAIPPSILGVSIGGGLFVVTSLGLGLFTLFWFLRGVAFYGANERKLALALPLAPVVSVVHSMGTVAGIIDPPDDFRVTEKAGTL